MACHNIHDNFHQKQFGGTFLLGSGPVTMNITSSGVDPSGLGCWSWLCLQGHIGRSIRIVCGYCPNEAKKASLQSVYSQQCHHLESLGDPTCPRAAFFRDLSASLATWQAAGNSIIFMANVNGDIWKTNFTAFCSAHSLREAIISVHPGLPTLATFRCGSLGKSPINSIWVSQDLPVAFSSWCFFQMSPGDHRAGIINLDLVTLIGEPCQQIVHPKVQWLTCTIPSSHDSYNYLLLEASQRHLLLPKLHALFTDTALPTFNWNSFGPCLEALDTLKSQCMQFAEKCC